MICSSTSSRPRRGRMMRCTSPGTANAGCIQQGAGVTLSGGGDCFCEKKKPTTVPVANGSSQTMGVDEAYIYHYAQYIYDPQDTAGGSRSGWAGSKLVGSCALLASKAKSVGGLLWDRSGSCLGSLSANRISGFPCNFGLRRDSRYSRRNYVRPSVCARYHGPRLVYGQLWWRRHIGDAFNRHDLWVGRRPRDSTG